METWMIVLLVVVLLGGGGWGYSRWRLVVVEKVIEARCFDDLCSLRS